MAVDRQEELGRWYLRLRGDEKDFVTVWLTIRQRTLHHETQVMPAPEVNVGETFEYLLRRNADLHQMRFALGAEDAVYLVGEVPVASVTEDELDRIVGSSARLRRRLLPDGHGIGFAGACYRRTPGAAPPSDRTASLARSVASDCLIGDTTSCALSCADAHAGRHVQRVRPRRAAPGVCQRWSAIMAITHRDTSLSNALVTVRSARDRDALLNACDVRVDESTCDAHLRGVLRGTG